MHLSKEEPANDRQSNTQVKAAQILLYDLLKALKWI